jgi:hypothetical protein
VSVDDEGRFLVAACWPDRRTAGRTVGDLITGTGRVHIDPLDAAAIVLGPDGRLRIEVDRPGPVTISGILGALIGVLISGPGWLILGGGVVEHLAADAVDAGLPPGPVRNFGGALLPGASAMITVVPAGSVPVLEHELHLLAAAVLVQRLGTPVVQRTGTRAAVRYAAGEVHGDVLAMRTAPAVPPAGPPGPTFTSHG